MREKKSLCVLCKSPHSGVWRNTSSKKVNPLDFENYGRWHGTVEYCVTFIIISLRVRRSFKCTSAVNTWHYCNETCPRRELRSQLQIQLNVCITTMKLQRLAFVKKLFWIWRIVQQHHSHIINQPLFVYSQHPPFDLLGCSEELKPASLKAAEELTKVYLFPNQ